MEMCILSLVLEMDLGILNLFIFYVELFMDVYICMVLGGCIVFSRVLKEFKVIKSIRIFNLRNLV